MDECKGVFGKWFGHKFQVRYSVIPSKKQFDIEGSTSAVLAAIKLQIKHVYHCDVCSRCGKVVNNRP